jgi:hypothetical protein
MNISFEKDKPLFRISISDEVSGIFNLSNPSSRALTLGLAQPLRELSTRNLPWGVKGDRSAYKTDNLNAIVKPIF